MGFFSRLRDTLNQVIIGRRQREATERFEKTREGRGRTYGATSETRIPDEQLGQIIEYAETGEWPEEPVDVYEVEETQASTRSYIPGPDPSSLRSGDLLSTAAFYGVTDEEYETLEGLINTAYNDPAASEWERRAASREIQNAMSDIYERAKETEDFDWAAWRDEHYPKGAR